MVAADIDTNSAAVSSSMTSSPKWRNTATSSASIGASRLPAGIPSTARCRRFPIGRDALCAMRATCILAACASSPASMLTRPPETPLTGCL